MPVPMSAAASSAPPATLIEIRDLTRVYVEGGPRARRAPLPRLPGEMMRHSSSGKSTCSRKAVPHYRQRSRIGYPESGIHLRSLLVL